MHAPTTSTPAAPVRVRRALMSVSDKTGLVDFARALHAMGCTIISTGGTAKALDAAGIPTTPIEQITGLPEMMDGRVKTLHPAVHGGLLAVRDNPEHAAALVRHRIEPIDLVVINLYPFEQTVAKPNVGRAEAIENIDIGGPSMVRSAAKNHAYVAVVTSPDQYAGVLVDLKANQSCTTPKLREALAREAFAMTARYDGAIAAYLAGASENAFPDTLSITFDKAQALRSGENPHQAAVVYRARGNAGFSVIPSTAPAGTQQLHGKELGYNNIADAAGAMDCVRRLLEAGKPGDGAVAIIKHANPCGAALGSASVGVAVLVDRAIAGDPVAAFGGILACSHEIDAPAAERLAGKDTFLEVILAPGFTPEALAILKAKSVNVRLLATGPVIGTDEQRVMMRTVPGGLLVQERDLLAPDEKSWQHVAGPAPTSSTIRAAMAVESMVRCMASNAIAIGGIDGPVTRLLGGGVGQVDRVTACRLAVEKSKQFASSLLSSGAAIAVSDAFFPFPDGPQILIDAGVKTIIHPGGSKRDAETFDLCNKHAVTCMITGVRRFKH